MKSLVLNWRTTVWALILPALYGAQAAGVDLHGIQLPPLETVWPFVLAQFGLGLTAKDHNVTGA